MYGPFVKNSIQFGRARVCVFLKPSVRTCSKGEDSVPFKHNITKGTVGTQVKVA